MINGIERSTGVSAASAPDVAEGCFPTGGGSLDSVAPKLVWPSVNHPRWPWIFLAIAAYLVVAFGAPAWSDYQNADNALGLLRGTEGLRADIIPDPLHYTLVNVTASAIAWETYVPARQQLDRDIIASALGVIAALVGLGALARGAQLSDYSKSLPEKGEKTASTGPSVSALLVTLWALGELLALSVFLILPVPFCYFATVELLQGDQLSWDLISETTNRTLDVIAGVFQSGG